MTLETLNCENSGGVKLTVVRVSGSVEVGDERGRIPPGVGEGNGYRWLVKWWVTHIAHK